MILDQNDNRPKWSWTKLIVDQNNIRPKWYSTKTIFDQNEIRPKQYSTKMIFDQNDNQPKRYSTKMIFDPVNKLFSVKWSSLLKPARVLPETVWAETNWNWNFKTQKLLFT